jgi:hypothetical protein
MRKLLLSILISAVFTLVGINSFALDVIPEDGQSRQHLKQQTNPVESEKQTDQAKIVNITTDIKGELTAINGATLSVRDNAGKIHSILITDPKTLEQLNVGDNVNVKIEKGLVVSIEKTESKSAEFVP